MEEKLRSKQTSTKQSQPSSKRWWLEAVAIPFFVTRFLIIATGLLSPLFLPLNYIQDPEVMSRGWLFSSSRLLDMWFRWDAGWYFTIVKEGYRMVENIYTTSNLAFFPVYPLLVRAAAGVFPSNLVTDELMVSIGVILSNLFLIGTLTLIYKISNNLFKNKQIAIRANWLLLTFPTAFFLSSFYSESTFLFFSLLTIWLAKKRRWFWACVAAAITGATRLVGLIIALPLIWEYLESKEWKLKKIDLSILWFGVVPVGVLVFFSYLYYLTGDFLAAIKVQSAWGKQVTNPFISFLKPTGYWPFVTALDRIVVLGVVIGSLKMALGAIKPLIPLGFYSLLIILPPLFTGTLDSVSRYAVVAFPVFMYLSYLVEKIENKAVRRGIVVVGGMAMMVLQLVLFARYSQFYWAG